METTFGEKSTAEEVARDIRLDDKNVIVTGANSGIGKECSRVLCKMGANVYMLCRDPGRGTSSRDDIIKELGETVAGRLHLMKCDLASFKSIREFSAEWEKLDLPLHILLNNAGIMACPRSETEDGFETQFGVNHLGHFLLTNLLLPSLKKAGSARVVNVSSNSHRISGIRFDVCGKTDIYDEWWGSWKAYGISKSANILFTNELDRRYKADGIHSNSLHPGVITTELGKTHWASPIMAFLGKFFNKTIPQGAATSIYVATAPELEGVGGKYFSDCAIAVPENATENEDDAKKLWELSEKWVGL
jgi:retinol dehydrogenase-12